MKQSSISATDEDLCCICEANPITEDPEETITFEECGHKYCNECARQSFKVHINEAKIDKLVCFAEDCGKKVTMDQLKVLFREEPDLIAKMNRFIDKK